MLTILLLTGCGAVLRKGHKKNRVTERLEIDRLFFIKDSVSKLENVKCVLIIQETNGDLYYEYENLDTGDGEFITGDSIGGFEKLVYSRKSDLAIKKNFYGNGNLKSIKQFFLGFPVPGIEDLQMYGRGFPIGMSQEYNEKGRLVREINNDLSFRFTLTDVKNYLLKKYGIDFQSTLKYAGIERYERDGNGVWSLKFSDPLEYGRFWVELDGNSGNVISKRKVISTY